MTQKQITTIKRHLTIKDGHPVTTTLDVSVFFGMKHKDVLRAISNKIADCSEEFAGRNFAPGSYADAQGQQRPMYELTRNGFTLLAMGFTGPRAMEFQIAYIEAFEQMERELRAATPSARAEAAIAMNAVYASAARAGHRSDFLPRLIHLRRAGLSCREAGKVLGVEQSTVAAWTRRLRDAGLDLPNLSRSTPAFMQATARQLSLPGVRS